MTILDDRSNLLAWEFGPKPKVAARRTAAISMALELLTYDLDEYLLPRMQAWNVPFIGLRFGTGNFWNEEDFEIVLSDTLGTRWFRDASGLGTAAAYLHEMGHVVDTFLLSRSNENRRAVSAAFCPTASHGWYPAASLTNAIGEAFADAFCSIYGGGIQPAGRGKTHHRLTPAVEAVIRGILES